MGRAVLARLSGLREQAGRVAGAVGGHFHGKLLPALAWLLAAVALGLAVAGIYLG